jgi:DNA-binding CsgD family transcriptional regulator
VALIERDGELGRIEALLARAGAATGRGAAVLVEGAPGIGKTTLLRAAADAATGLGVGALAAHGGELERDLPFAIVRQLFESRLRAASTELRADLLEGAAALAAPVFDGPADGADPAAMGTVVHGLYWLCSNLAEQGPLLISVDDVHWADEASLRFLSHLARRVADLPVLLILAGRAAPPDEVGAAARALSGVEPSLLRLAPLSDHGVAVLVREALSVDADEEFCRACAHATGGNPFLLVEALAALRADGIAPVSAQAPRVSSLHPDTISRAVLARLARLGPEAIRLARAVAVLGPAAELRRGALLAGLDQDRAAAVVDALVHEAVVAPTRPIEFVHPLVRTAVYGDTSETLRALTHKRAARLLAADHVDADQLAPHLLAAAPEADGWVVATLRVAASSALARGAPEPAAAYLARALAEPPDAAERGPVLLALGRALGMLNREGEASAALREAFELAEDPAVRIESGLELAAVVTLAGRGAEAGDVYRRIAAVADAGDPDLPLQLLWVSALGGLSGMRPPHTWLGQLDQVAPGLTGGSDVERLALATLAFAASACGDRPHGEVARLARLAADGPLTRRAPWLLVNFTSAALAVSGRPQEALAVLNRGIAQTRRGGDMAAFGYLSVLRSHTALEAGALPEAEADGRAAVEISRDRPQETPLAAAVLIEALIEQGAVDAAERVFADAGLAGERDVDWVIAHIVLMARARLRLRQRRPAEALTDLLSTGRAMAGAGYLNPAFAHWRAEAATAHLALGAVDAARELVAEELELARGFAAPRAVGIALRVAALVEGGAAGLDLLHESVEVLDGSGAELEHARSLVELGSARRRLGQRGQALIPLRQGFDLATRCGARTLAQRARDELVAAGARPRRASLSGRDALTAAELRVARMAAAGEGNRAVAQALFITRRTVEVHLTNVYRKLGIAARAELAAALDPPQPPTG